MSSALAEEGLELVKARKYAEGIEKLSAAIKERQAPLWLLERSKAYLRTDNVEHALYDAELALSIALKRGNRDHMIDAQFRRSIAFVRMERFADADVCAFWTWRLIDGAKANEEDGQEKRVDEKGLYTVTMEELKQEAQADVEAARLAGMSDAMGTNKTKKLRAEVMTWRFRARNSLLLLDADSPGRKVSIVKYPVPVEPATSARNGGSGEGDATGIASTAMMEAQETKTDNDKDEDVDMARDRGELEPRQDNYSSPNDLWKAIYVHARRMYTESKIRSDFYQTDSTINVSLFVKNVPEQGLEVQQTLDTQIIIGPIPSIPSNYFILNLYDAVARDSIQIVVKSMKLELSMRKVTSSKWPCLTSHQSRRWDDIMATTADPHGPDAWIKFRNFVHEPWPRALPNQLAQPPDLSLVSWYQVLQWVLNPQVAVFCKDVKKYYFDLEGFWLKFQKSKFCDFTKAIRAYQNELLPDETKTEDDSFEREIKAFEAQGGLEEDSWMSPDDSSQGRSVGQTAPVYPTSSKKGPKNWDTMKLDDFEDDESETNPDHFFKKLYQSGNDDMRRAMMKSYTESNGTSLSTDWTEAASKTYNTEPPQGVQAKNWE